MSTENGNGEKPLSQWELREYRELKEQFKDFIDEQTKKKEFKQQLSDIVKGTGRWLVYFIGGLWILTEVLTRGFNFAEIVKILKTMGWWA